MKPEQVIEEVKKANLRGRGGAGFPAGVKWETTRNTLGDPKYVIVNCDEGDPGAFMDRSLMEGNPHSILEGLIIGAYVIGAHRGYIYVREEYPIAVENISSAIRQAEEYGLLGENIMGAGFSFRVQVHKGAGAFVSGEETSLISAIEGKIGESKPKPPYPAVKGLRGKPTNINNVKTWANVPSIILKGAEWFRSIGTKGSSGTMIFSLVGKINNTGLVEVPMGITFRELIYEIGGGIRGGKRFKTVQTGGPSGGFIPEKYLDIPVDFDELAQVGSMMGSGGMVVMDEDTCMVDISRYFVDFLLEESCGKCIPCREGLRVLSKILNDICEGKGKDKDLQTTEDIVETMREASLCALGRTAANPVLTSLKYFRDEWEEHIKEKRCPAKVCKALINYYIEPKKCQACLSCLGECPVEAVQGDKDLVHWIDQEKCIKCGTCYEICTFGAVKKLSGEPILPTPKGMKPTRKMKGGK
jgi:NADH-quinone oxidoreductase subunit F